MKKIITTIINILSAVPILFYSFILGAGFMIFDAPGSGQYILNWGAFFASVLYPVFIIVFIIASRKNNSLPLALVALLPLLFLLFVLFTPIETAQKDDYNTRSKDFICDSNSFLSVEKNGDFGGINLLKKKNFYTYENGTIATIENMSINIFSENPKETKNLLSNCKNKEGKSLLDIYNLISK